MLARRLGGEGFDIYFASTLARVRTPLDHPSVDYALTELRFSDGGALSAKKALRSSAPLRRTVVHSRSCSLQVAVQATKAAQANRSRIQRLYSSCCPSCWIEASLTAAEANFLEILYSCAQNTCWMSTLSGDLARVEQRESYPCTDAGCKASSNGRTCW